MTKQEKILEAWGENLPPDGVCENGWSIEPVNHSTFDIRKYDQLNHINGTYIRPKTLRGVETNNRWTKLETWKDMPTDNIDCFAIHKNGYTLVVNSRKDSFWCADNKRLYDWYDFTHYKPIPKQEPPIY